MKIFLWIKNMFDFFKIETNSLTYIHNVSHWIFNLTDLDVFGQFTDMIITKLIYKTVQLLSKQTNKELTLKVPFFEDVFSTSDLVTAPGKSTKAVYCVYSTDIKYQLAYDELSSYNDPSCLHIYTSEYP